MSAYHLADHEPSDCAIGTPIGGTGDAMESAIAASMDAAAGGGVTISADAAGDGVWIP